MTLGLELLALIGKLLDLEAVHEKGHLQFMAVEKIHEAPDADAVAVLPFGDRRHVFLVHGIGRRNGVRALALQRLAGGEVFRPHLPGNNESNADFSLVGPFDDSWSRHVFPSEVFFCNNVRRQRSQSPSHARTEALLTPTYLKLCHSAHAGGLISLLSDDTFTSNFFTAKNKRKSLSADFLSAFVVVISKTPPSKARFRNRLTLRAAIS